VGVRHCLLLSELIDGKIGTQQDYMI
jgi:hypothetical protein